MTISFPHSGGHLDQNAIVRRGRLRGRRDFAAERAAAQERERRIREAEDTRIRTINENMNTLGDRVASINEQIYEMQNSETEPDTELLKSLNREIAQLETTLDGMAGQIARIHINRAEREQQAMEREFMRKQEEMEERIRERERLAEEKRLENKDEEELEEAAERAKIRGFAQMSVRAENISALSQTRASMQAEATRLSGEAEFDKSRQRIANREIISNAQRQNVQRLEAFRDAKAHAEEYNLPFNRSRPAFVEAGPPFDHNPLSPDGFRGRHLGRLNAGIAGLTANINHQIAALYRDSQQLQESQLRINREKSMLPEEEDEENAQ